MDATILQLVILFLAGLFSGLTLFLATVLRRVFNDLPEAAFHDLFSRVIHFGRRSILINILVAAPVILLAAYPFFYQNSDPLFYAGGFFYVIGSLAISQLLNEPTYNEFLHTSREDTARIAQLRSRLNRLNIARAAFSTLGAVLIACAVAL